MNKVQGLWGFWAGKHMEVLGEWLIWRRHGSSAPFPHALPYTSLPAGCTSVSFIIFFYNKLVNSLSKLFLSSVRCSNKLIKP